MPKKEGGKKSSKVKSAAAFAAALAGAFAISYAARTGDIYKPIKYATKLTHAVKSIDIHNISQPIVRYASKVRASQRLKSDEEYEKFIKNYRNYDGTSCCYAPYIKEADLNDDNKKDAFVVLHSLKGSNSRIKGFFLLGSTQKGYKKYKYILEGKKHEYIKYDSWTGKEKKYKHYIFEGNIPEEFLESGNIEYKIYLARNSGRPNEFVTFLKGKYSHDCFGQVYITKWNGNEFVFERQDISAYAEKTTEKETEKLPLLIDLTESCRNISTSEILKKIDRNTFVKEYNDTLFNIVLSKAHIHGSMPNKEFVETLSSLGGEKAIRKLEEIYLEYGNTMDYIDDIGRYLGKSAKTPEEEWEVANFLYSLAKNCGNRKYVAGNSLHNLAFRYKSNRYARELLFDAFEKYTNPITGEINLVNKYCRK